MKDYSVSYYKGDEEVSRGEADRVVVRQNWEHKAQFFGENKFVRAYQYLATLAILEGTFDHKLSALIIRVYRAYAIADETIEFKTTKVLADMIDRINECDEFNPDADPFLSLTTPLAEAHTLAMGKKLRNEVRHCWEELHALFTKPQ